MLRQMKLISEYVLNEKIHWKPKVLYMLQAMNYLNLIIDYNCPEVLAILECAFKLAICDNIHLNQLGRAVLFHMLNDFKRKHTHYE